MAILRTLTAFAHRHLLPDVTPLSPQERRRSVGAALLGMLLIQGILAVIPASGSVRQLLAPLGATSVILFALPHSPLGQPWSVAGGLLLSALAGLLCAHWITLPWLAIALALALAVWLMALLRCLHPPGGAMAVYFACGSASLQGTDLLTAAINGAAVLAAALAVNALVPGRRWPQGATDHPPVTPRERHPAGLHHEDLQYALAQVDGFLDISEDDLVAVFDQALGHAFSRHDTLTCGDLMHSGPITVEFATPLAEAWMLLRRQTMLPVTDRAGRLIGQLGPEDFMREIQPVAGLPLGDSIRRFLQPTPGPTSAKPEVVGQIMSPPPRSVQTDLPLGELLGTPTLLPTTVPVIDATQRLAGLLTQDRVVEALYQRQALAEAAIETSAPGPQAA